MLKPYLIPFSLFLPCNIRKQKNYSQREKQEDYRALTLKHKVLLNVKALPHSLLIVSAL
jgi:hypothetical protein